MTNKEILLLMRGYCGQKLYWDEVVFYPCDPTFSLILRTRFTRVRHSYPTQYEDYWVLKGNVDDEPAQCG